MSDVVLNEQKTAAKLKNTGENANVIANVIEISVSVISKLAGKDIADALDKQSLNRTVLSNLVANRIKEKVLSKE